MNQEKENKKIHRFLVSEIPQSDIFDISEKRIVHQIAKVLNIKLGEELILFINDGDDEIVSLESVEKNNLRVKKNRTLLKSLVNPKNNLTVAIGIPKGSVFEIIVQKLTEIGVSQIVPILSDRTVKGSVRIERLQTISDEALEQCGGNKRVKIYEPLSLSECVRNFKSPSIVFTPEGEPFDSFEKDGSEMTAYVGPEGGWSKKDLELLKEVGVSMLSLGPRILRTETACIVGSYKLLWR